MRAVQDMLHPRSNAYCARACGMQRVSRPRTSWRRRERTCWSCAGFTLTPFATASTMPRNAPLSGPVGSRVAMPQTFSVEIHLLPTEAGGRHSPLSRDEWRTILGINAEHWSARLRFTGNPGPGDTFAATMQLLVPEAGEYFPVGAEFTVWEGGTKGIGRVLSVAT